VSLAYRLTFQPLERSLEDSELDGIISRVSAELERSLRGRVRGPHGTA
jgi:phenylalanyl-tRNA synthetase beta subunit